MTATFHVGDAIEVMGKLPEKSVDLILTSPPFLALRSYLPADHPDKALEGGSQATPGQYIDWLVDVVEACDRVLAPHGSLCIELGDTYAGAMPAYNYTEAHSSVKARTKTRRDGLENEILGITDGSNRVGPGWPLAKSLSLIPELFRLTLVYGINPLTGRTTDRWRLRNVVRWVRPNPPVGALGDKFRPATSELMVFCKSAKRYFDLDAVREPYSAHSEKLYRGGEKAIISGPKTDARDNKESAKFDRGKLTSPIGAPPLDWWNIPLSDDEEPTRYGPKGYEPPRYTRATSGKNSETPTASHRMETATGSNPAGAPPLDWWNIPLLEGEEETRYGPKPEKPHGTTGFLSGNKFGIRQKVENTETQPLGAPPLDWWNIPPGGYEGAHYAVFPPELCVKPVKAMCPEKVCKVCGEPSRRIVDAQSFADGVPTDGTYVGRRDRTDGIRVGEKIRATFSRTSTTLGWTDCGHNDWRPGLVLDPFVGSGTTLMVATGHGRDAIGIDLDERNFDLALSRVGPFILECAGE